ncbi:MAG TPA: response regulator transcription factor [Candidatus Aquilonibacter sp.]|nr:response regulator transcription factor [Candidatus Aquilonibacter sp.]
MTSMIGPGAQSKSSKVVGADLSVMLESRDEASRARVGAVSAPTLARNSRTNAPEASAGDNGKPEPGKKTYRILIADDHEALRRGLRSALLGAGWQVCGEAADGKQAVEKTKELKPDLVLLDLSMPVMSGHEAAREILRNNPDVKIVVFTMHESQQVRDALSKIGVHALAVKSAPLSLLLDTIQTVLGS